MNFTDEIQKMSTAIFLGMAERIIPRNDPDKKADLARKILVQAISYTSQCGGDLRNLLLNDRQVNKWTGGRTWDVDVAQCYAISRLADYELGKRAMQEFARNSIEDRKDEAKKSKGLLNNFLAFLRR